MTRTKTKKPSLFVRAVTFPYRQAVRLYRWLGEKIYWKITTQTMLIYLSIYVPLTVISAFLMDFFIRQNPEAAHQLIFILIPIGATVLGVLGHVFTGGMMRPVRRMTNTVKSISAGSLSTRIDLKHAQDELKELGDVINRMLEDLESTFHAQDAFVGDVSHELKTPLAVLNGRAELLLRWGAGDPYVLQESAEAIRQQVDYMTKMIASMLILARAGMPTKREEFYINDLVEEVVAYAREQTKVHAVRLGEMQAFTVTSDRSMMEQLFRNLVENAVKYTPPGGSVTVSCVKREDGCPCVSITDTGVGISAEDLPHVFERFYRADKARTHGSSGGLGLGLPIAKKLTEALGGEIVLTSTLGQGTAATVLLPPAPDDGQG
ncbi:MAG: HAMP domain-containing histidine kinase [Clostridiales bacterium]|jgi:signal transduction histidine kinase|nr:HAMP domain-containing histidine kinase [Clostridiales bacterium]